MDEQIEYPQADQTPQSDEGFSQEVSGEVVNFGPGMAITVSAEQDVWFSEGVALGAAAGRDMHFQEGGVFGVAAGRDLAMSESGAFSLVVGGNAQFSEAGTLVAVTGAMTATNSSIGVVFGPTTLNEGSRLLLDTKQAAIFGAAFGAAAALLSWLLRKK